MSIITKPFTVSIKTPELTKRRLKAAVIRVLKDVGDQYQREVAAWCEVFCPRDTGALKEDLKASASKYFLMNTDLEVGIVLFLDSMLPYSELVEMMSPPINWTNPMSEYQFFSTLVQELTNVSIPRMIRTAIQREGLV